MTTIRFKGKKKIKIETIRTSRSRKAVDFFERNQGGARLEKKESLARKDLALRIVRRFFLFSKLPRSFSFFIRTFFSIYRNIHSLVTVKIAACFYFFFLVMR